VHVVRVQVDEVEFVGGGLLEAEEVVGFAWDAAQHADELFHFHELFDDTAVFSQATGD
jgi:hypothetical protein